jgi:tetraacyldisaccharide 4'-kinase
VFWLKQIILWKFSLLYALAIAIWNCCRRFTRRVKLDCKVISVGNITAGGTGKTPVVIYLAKMAEAAGHKTAVVARGYKRKVKGLIEVDSQSTWQEVGDEPLEIFRLTDNVRVYVDNSKTKAAQQAAKDGADVIIIDDGFQHRKLHRDYDIVCLDWTSPFSNGHLLPLGLLREPIGNIKRSDAIIFTSYDRNVKNSIDKSYLPQKQYYSTIRIEKFYNIKSNKIKDIESFKNLKAVAFAGLGNPAKFEKSLRESGIDLAEFVAFPDHHHYSTGDIDQLIKYARHLRPLGQEHNAKCLITTFKDIVKIDSFDFAGFDVYSAMLGLSIIDSSGADGHNELKTWLGL